MTDTLRLLARTCHLPAAAQAADASAAAINGGRGRGGRGGRDGRGVARITIGGGRGGAAESSAAASTGSGQKGEVRYEQANILALPKSVDETVRRSPFDLMDVCACWFSRPPKHTPRHVTSHARL